MWYLNLILSNITRWRGSGIVRHFGLLSIFDTRRSDESCLPVIGSLYCNVWNTGPGDHIGRWWVVCEHVVYGRSIFIAVLTNRFHVQVSQLVGVFGFHAGVRRGRFPAYAQSAWLVYISHVALVQTNTDSGVVMPVNIIMEIGFSWWHDVFWLLLL